MKGEERPFYKRTDIIIIAAVIIVCAAVAVLMFMNRMSMPSGDAEIYKDGTLVKSVKLSKAQEFTVNGAVFEVKNGEIRFKNSDCPDKLCVNTGFIGKINDIAVCLPNKLYIKITGALNSDAAGPDVIAE